MAPVDKQSLKKQYKDKIPLMGVYLITNKKNGKRLLGVSSNIPGIFNRLKFELRAGSCRHAALLADWQTYGEEQFSFEVLDELKPLSDPNYDYSEDLKVLLQLWRDKLPAGEYYS